MSLLLPLIFSQVPAVVLSAVITLDLQAPWNVAACAWSLFVCWTCGQHAKTDVIFIDYCLGVLIAVTAMDAIYMTLLVRPLHVFHHRKQIESAHKLPWFERFIWAIKLCSSPRRIGWDHQVKNLPDISTKSRKEFILSRLMTAAMYYLCFDLTQFYMRHNPAFKSFAAFTSPMFVRRALACANYLLCYYSMTVVVYALVVVLVVSCTSTEPSSWPNLFGKMEHAYTIRRFWGRFWHQSLRRVLTPFGKRMALFLGFRPGTNGSAYTQLYTGFIVSAIAHIAGDATNNPSRLGISCPFLIYQAFAITFEDMVISVARRAGVKESRWTRVMGYVWVISWFIFTGEQWVSEVIIAGGENGVQLNSFKYFPPSLCEILVNFVQ